MIGIVVTQIIKDQNELINTVGSILTRNNYPNKFWNTERVVGGYQNRTDLHSADGWRDVVQPSFNTATQKRGAIYFDEANDVFTYEVINKTDEEIQSELISQSQSNKQELIQRQVEAQIVSEAQELDDNDALEKQDIYPLWNDFDEEHLFEPPIKVQDFVDNELKLFRAIQPNNKRENTKPILYPAGWTLIEFSGGIEIWSQPIGGDGKYPYIDPLTGNPYLVEHNGQIWQNDFQGGLNVWEPGVFGWIIYTP